MNLIGVRASVMIIALTVIISSGLIGVASADDPELAEFNQSNLPALANTILSPIQSTIRSVWEFWFGPRSNNVYGIQIDPVEEQKFESFTQRYNKTYTAEELPKRMSLYVTRSRMIRQSEIAYREGRLPFRMQENEYVDRDDKELRSMTGIRDFFNEDTRLNRPQSRYRRSVGSYSNTDLVVKTGDIPASIDWRDSGCVDKPTTSQGDCSSCYAFAAIGAVESMYCIKNRRRITYSPQQIVDCGPSSGYLLDGCDGGSVSHVFLYLRQAGKVAKQRCYPYLKRKSACKLDALVTNRPRCVTPASPTNTTLDYEILLEEEEILQHVANTGPVVATLEATEKLMFYGSGIFDDPKCSKRWDVYNHAVLVVGYGRENGQDYWLIRNSWGLDWGRSGFGKIKRGTSACSFGYWGWVIRS